MPAPVRRFLGLGLTLGAALVLAAGAAAGNGGLAPPDPDSPNADRIRDIYWLLSAVGVAIFLIVTVPLVVFMIRYRSAGRDRSVEGPQVRGNTNLEIGWTVGAVLVLVVIAGYVFYKLPGIQTLQTAGAAEELRVQVEGRQFYWQYRYPNGAIAIDRLRAPVGRVVELEITAPEGDVAHSFWVPALFGKFDAIPGVTNETSFNASETGVYPGVCAEFCGIQHALMEAQIEVLPADEFESWVEERAGDTEALGEEEWNGVCAKCHRLGDEDQLIGPTLSAAQLQDAEQLEHIVRNGRNKMPAVGQGWGRAQMEALTEYLADRFGGEGTGGGGQG
jgi:cytochrome c oxidase subunit 2